MFEQPARNISMVPRKILAPLLAVAMIAGSVESVEAAAANAHPLSQIEDTPGYDIDAKPIDLDILRESTVKVFTRPTDDYDIQRTSKLYPICSGTEVTIPQGTFISTASHCAKPLVTQGKKIDAMPVERLEAKPDTHAIDVAHNRSIVPPEFTFWRPLGRISLQNDFIRYYVAQPQPSSRYVYPDVALGKVDGFAVSLEKSDQALLKITPQVNQKQLVDNVTSLSYGKPESKPKVGQGVVLNGAPRSNNDVAIGGIGRYLGRIKFTDRTLDFVSVNDPKLCDHGGSGESFIASSKKPGEGYLSGSLLGYVKPRNLPIYQRFLGINLKSFKRVCEFTAYNPAVIQHLVEALNKPAKSNHRNVR